MTVPVGKAAPGGDSSIKHHSACREGSCRLYNKLKGVGGRLAECEFYNLSFLWILNVYYYNNYKYRYW